MGLLVQRVSPILSYQAQGLEENLLLKAGSENQLRMAEAPGGGQELRI